MGLNDTVRVLLGVSEQGGGCPAAGHEQLWPNVSNISAGPLGGELSHWARFTEIAAGRRFQGNDTVRGGPTGAVMFTNWSQVTPTSIQRVTASFFTDLRQVYNFKANPKLSDFAAGTEAHNLTLDFARKYTTLLAQLHVVFNGYPERFGDTILAMHELGTAAIALMGTQDPRGAAGMGIGPTWEYVRTV